MKRASIDLAKLVLVFKELGQISYSYTLTPVKRSKVPCEYGILYRTRTTSTAPFILPTKAHYTGLLSSSEDFIDAVDGNCISGLLMASGQIVSWSRGTPP